jgi:hypothetical protein
MRRPTKLLGLFAWTWVQPGETREREAVEQGKFSREAREASGHGEGNEARENPNTVWPSRCKFQGISEGPLVTEVYNCTKKNGSRGQLETYIQVCNNQFLLVTKLVDIPPYKEVEETVRRSSQVVTIHLEGRENIHGCDQGSIGAPWVQSPSNPPFHWLLIWVY